VEAAELSAAAGQVLDPWQQLVLNDILGVRDDGIWSAFETCTVVQRQCGKGAIIEAVELAGLFLLGEQLILHSAHEYKTAQEAFLRIKALIEGCDDLMRHVKVIREANGEQQVILRSGARLRFVARSKGSGRGFSGQRNILDEAYALTRSQLAALLPTMSAQPNPQMNLFSTVPDVDTLPPEGEEAVLPDVHKRALVAVESGDPGRLAYHDWSAPRDSDPTDVDLWYECNPALGIRVSEDYVRAELAALGNRKFGTERLGIWEDDDRNWHVISRTDWFAAADPESKAVDPVAFAVVLSTDRDWPTICAAGAREDGLIHVTIVDRRKGTGWVVPRLVELWNKWDPCAVVIDKGSPAASFVLEAEQAGVDLLPIQTRDVAAAAGMFFDGVSGLPDVDGADPRVIRWRPHESQEPLTTAVAGALKRPLSTTFAWDQMAATVDISPLIGVSNALWGFRASYRSFNAGMFTL